MADVYLMNIWKAKIHSGEYSSASSFLVKITSPGSTDAEKKCIIESLDDWRVITATWFEMARHIDGLEALARTTKFSGYRKAALLCSKAYYCLEKYDAALEYALASGDEFKLMPRADDFKSHDFLVCKFFLS